MQQPIPSAGRVVAITGASSGIGRATALLFARDGYQVGLIARGEPGLADVAREIERAGGRAAIATADVADAEALEQAAATIERQLGRIDVWINDAGASFYAKFTEMSPEEFRRVTETTYFGAVNGTRIALQRMMPRNRGSIVNIGSVAAYRGFPLQAPYCGAKFALRGFTEAVRSELVDAGSAVHLGIVHPPGVNTPFFAHAGARMQGVPKPPPPIYQPEVVAEAVKLVVEQRRRELVIGGGRGLVWMNRIAPGLLDWIAGKTGVPAQQATDAGARQSRMPALFSPPDGASPVRGRWGGFEHSAQLWLSRNRGLVAGGAGLAVLALLAGRTARRP
ncbi:MAG: SDR family NAD(P)-dependent oxidoreductase [Rhodospirillales bacterium]|nr:SDR family NAD(P)-dependent oxidoreductase [Rhodospirillales bacterium]